MEIFGIGLPELLVILILALIVFGPERLPKIARDLGSTLASFRREAEGIRQEFIASMEEVGGPVQDSIQELRSALNITARPAPFALPDAGESAAASSSQSASPAVSVTAPRPILPPASAPTVPSAKGAPSVTSALPADDATINTRAQLAPDKHRQAAAAKPLHRRLPVEEAAAPASQTMAAPVPASIEPSSTPSLDQTTPAPLPAALAPTPELEAELEGEDAGDDFFGSPTLLTTGEAAIPPTLDAPTE